jgi:hypothetical protein
MKPILSLSAAGAAAGAAAGLQVLLPSCRRRQHSHGNSRQADHLDQSAFAQSCHEVSSRYF